MDKKIYKVAEYVSQKFLKRLQVFALHHKESDDINRGTDIFSDNPKYAKEQAQFLRCVLECIVNWAQMYPEDFKNDVGEMVLSPYVLANINL